MKFCTNAPKLYNVFFEFILSVKNSFIENKSIGCGNVVLFFQEFFKYRKLSRGFFSGLYIFPCSGGARTGMCFRVGTEMRSRLYCSANRDATHPHGRSWLQMKSARSVAGPRAATAPEVVRICLIRSPAFSASHRRRPGDRSRRSTPGFSGSFSALPGHYRTCC